MRDETMRRAAGSTGERVSIRRAGLALAPASLSDAHKTLRAFAAEAPAVQLPLIPLVPLDLTHPTSSHLSRFIPLDPGESHLIPASPTRKLMISPHTGCARRACGPVRRRGPRAAGVRRQRNRGAGRLPPLRSPGAEAMEAWPPLAAGGSEGRRRRPRGGNCGQGGTRSRPSRPEPALRSILGGAGRAFRQIYARSAGGRLFRNGTLEDNCQ